VDAVLLANCESTLGLIIYFIRNYKTCFLFCAATSLCDAFSTYPSEISETASQTCSATETLERVGSLYRLLDAIWRITPGQHMKHITSYKIPNLGVIFCTEKSLLDTLLFLSIDTILLVKYLSRQQRRSQALHNRPDRGEPPLSGFFYFS
jgi:hypothetical protein